MTTGLLIVLMVASFYFLIIRPNRKRQAEQTKLTNSMQPGTQVMLNSGIYAKVIEVGQKQIYVELAPDVEVLVLKQAVMQVVTPESQFAIDEQFADDDDPAEDEDEAETQTTEADEKDLKVEEEWPSLAERLSDNGTVAQDPAEKADPDPRDADPREGQKG